MKISNILCGLILAGMVVPAIGQQSGSGWLINIQVSQNIPTVNYWTRGSTNVGFVGTALLPRATGQAKVGAQKGSLQIQGDFKGSRFAYKFWPRVPGLCVVGDYAGGSCDQPGTNDGQQSEEQGGCDHQVADVRHDGDCGALFCGELSQPEGCAFRTPF